MNEIIKEQLRKVKSTNIDYSNDSIEIMIPKTSINNFNIKVGNIYDIELADELLKPQENSMLVSNWNVGKIPKSKKYKVEILNIMQKMVKVNGVGLDNSSDNFYGWLPQEKFKVINEN